MLPKPETAEDFAGIVEELRSALGDAAVLVGDDIPARNERDWSPLPASRPLAVLRPDSPEGVAAAVRICVSHDIAVVPQGGLTGLCGGARADGASVALSLERFVGVEEIDAAAGTMTVRAGTPLETVQRAAEAAGFFCALDLGARGSCTIGGNLSTNAGGNRVIRYGMAREMVLGLEAVLPDGTLVSSLNKMMKNNAGYDLKQLFVGSEGTLGIITRAVLRLHPQPGCTMAALCGLSSYDKVLELLAAARRGLGPILSAFEVMWPDYWEVVTRQVPNVRSPIGGDHAVYVLVEAQGTDATVDGPRFQDWLEQLAEAGTVADAAVAQSLADVKAFWGVRDACAEFNQVLGRHQSFDIGLPIAEMNRYVEACGAELRAQLPGVVALFYGHIGDGNLHIVACQPGVEPQPKETIDEVIYGCVRRFGGTVSAEHGIGTTKKRWLGYTRSPIELALMRTVKAALDPRNLLNPGKVL
ncbi:oxidoreductase [Aliidongia dinghuensis]|uniref:Oxidoreductase n=1 Tax=Aliidongia dinghuensis TaxID=1867774 RepID=A0A8J2Z0G9_9PROT|nr:FAD-binding oxidoreductase [Aliidongia dinghuensis]GGF44526.1 oxidoreductase [Aliidongia dinghuensis]